MGVKGVRMLDIPWKDHLPNEDLQGGIDLANLLYWDIVVGSDGHYWGVFGGESLILKTDSKETMEAFLYGMGLAYSVIPEPVFALLREELKKWVE